MKIYVSESQEWLSRSSQIVFIFNYSSLSNDEDVTGQVSFIVRSESPGVVQLETCREDRERAWPITWFPVNAYDGGSIFIGAEIPLSAIGNDFP